MSVSGDILHAGHAMGPTLVLSEPLSFWGAFDPRTGIIVDVHHPQCGACLAGKILLLPETRGSGGTPGGIAEAIRLNTAPRGIILMTPDINLAIGASVAKTLYARDCPIIVVAAVDFAALITVQTITIAIDGTVSAR